MKQIFIAVTFTFISYLSYCQSNVDTLFLDSKKEEVKKKKCIYYRVLTKVNDSLYNFQDYWIEGVLDLTGNFSSINPNVRQGKFTSYHKNGTVETITYYKNNNAIGLSQLFNDTGQLELEYISNIDSLDNADAYNNAFEDFLKHVLKYIDYPERAAKTGKQGIVFLSFYINDFGQMERLTIYKSVDQDLDNEAIRVVKSFNKWPIPIYKGNRTWIRCSFPVAFQL